MCVFMHIQREPSRAQVVSLTSTRRPAERRADPRVRFPSLKRREQVSEALADAASGQHATRLETRTKESTSSASGQVENLERVTKVKAPATGAVGRSQL